VAGARWGGLSAMRVPDVADEAVRDSFAAPGTQDFDVDGSSNDERASS